MANNDKNRAAQLSLLLGDIVLAIITLLLVTAIRYGQNWSTDILGQHLAVFVPVIVFNLISHYAFGLYDANKRPTNAEIFAAALRSQLLTTLVGAVFFYFIPQSVTTLEPRRVLLGYTIGLLPLTWLWQISSRRVLQKVLPSLKVLVLGQNDRSNRLVSELQKASYLGYEIVEQVSPEKDAITNALEKYNPELIVNALEEPASSEVISALQRCLIENRAVIGLAAFTELALRKVPVEDIDQWWFIENFSSRKRLVFEALKRLSDIIISIIGLILTLPFLPFIIIAVKSTAGPVLFKQLRSGRGNKPFLAIKFRSMYVNAEANGPQWAQVNDPRVTKAGRFLRASRLDEIPQLINILKGDMSFVGPRPERPEFITSLVKQIPFYSERSLVKPGLTGWAQINYPYGDSVEDALEKLRFDLYYIKNRSAIIDISTILKTINTVLRGLGR